jgi:hypothetical protein
MARVREYALDDLVERAAALRAQGHSFMQTYRCEGCRLRITLEPANKLFQVGECSKCGHVTEIEKGTLLEILTGGVK